MFYKAQRSAMRLQFMKFATKATDRKKLFSNTIILPKTKFPLRLDSKSIVERDLLINNVIYALLLCKIILYIILNYRIKSFKTYIIAKERSRLLLNLCFMMVHHMQMVHLIWDMQLIRCLETVFN